MHFWNVMNVQLQTWSKSLFNIRGRRSSLTQSNHPLCRSLFVSAASDAIQAVPLRLLTCSVHYLRARHCSKCFYPCRQIETPLRIKQTFALPLWKYSSDGCQRLSRALFLTQWSARCTLIMFVLMCVKTLNTFVVVVAYLYVRIVKVLFLFALADFYFLWVNLG